MGSTTPPSSSQSNQPTPASSPKPSKLKHKNPSQQSRCDVDGSEQRTEALSDSTIQDLRDKLRAREKEIQSLRVEVESYKRALTQHGGKGHSDDHSSYKEGESDRAGSHLDDWEKGQDLLLAKHRSRDANIYPGKACQNSPKPEHDDDTDLAVVESDAKESNQSSTGVIITNRRSSYGKKPQVSSKSVLFDTTTATKSDEGESDNSEEKQRTNDKGGNANDSPLQKQYQAKKFNHDGSNTKDDNNGSDDIEAIIQDVGEIDLNLGIDDDLDTASLGDDVVTCVPSGGSMKHDENIFISDTNKKRLDSGSGNSGSGNFSTQDDEAISDGLLLTSLTDAAINNLSQLAALQERCESQQQHSHHRYQSQQAQQASDCPPCSNILATSQSNTTATSPDQTYNPLNVMSHQQIHRRPTSTSEFISDLFSSGTVSGLGGCVPSNQVLQHHASPGLASQQQQQTMIVPSSSSCLTTQLSSSASIQSSADLTSSTSQSLASVVAAAAVAAAAANDQQQHHHQVSHQHHRLISSGIGSPELYKLMQSPSPILHFSSSSTSVTPSSAPNFIVAPSRRSISALPGAPTMMSPIASPNYLRRPFMADRFQMITPSSGLGSGNSTSCSVAAPTPSLAHILQHQQNQQQQRSVSTVPGPASSPTPSSSGLAVSPLMCAKNSAQARLNNMQIRNKFGFLGNSRGQFNSPHGFCLGLTGELIVADTNNHRVCTFDKVGTCLAQFGTPGKEEGQLWNPRKVVVLPHPPNFHGSEHSSTRYLCPPSPFHLQGFIDSEPLPDEPLFVVCDRGSERSRMQIFTLDGIFIKKISIHFIDIVAGLAVTHDGLITVVDSVSPTVYVINGDSGMLEGWFDCSGHMKEPSDIAVKPDSPGHEYFICDFKGHCVVVFNEAGEYVRKIGHDGLTSYPNGIDISDDGDILVGDSHGNRFHVVVFDRNGNFVSQFECPHVKVSRCCGLKITKEGFIVTLAKNNHHVLILDTIHI